jgi:hypothetical protein
MVDSPYRNFVCAALADGFTLAVAAVRASSTGVASAASFLALPAISSDAELATILNLG